MVIISVWSKVEMMAHTAQLSSVVCAPAAIPVEVSSRRFATIVGETHPSMLKLRGRIWADAPKARTGASRKYESLIVIDGTKVGVVQDVLVGVEDDR